LSQLSRSYDSPLVPSRETRHSPDQTEIVEELPEQGKVVYLEEVKEFVPIRHDSYDTTVNRLIGSVTAQIEDHIRQDVVKKIVRSYWRRTPQIARLSRGPHGDIISVKVKDTDGNETTLEEGVDFRVQGMKYKSLVGFAHFGELTVEYESGYGTDKFPKQISGAVMQEISLQFKNRQDPDTPAMTSVDNLSLEARHLLASIVRRAL
jgi:hypothetical protein